VVDCTSVLDGVVGDANRLIWKPLKPQDPSEGDARLRVIEEAEQADLAARGAGAALSGRLRICAAVTFARLHVMPHLRR
jgi:hypothetical protein